jgi:hypothetical protein
MADRWVTVTFIVGSLISGLTPRRSNSGLGGAGFIFFLAVVFNAPQLTRPLGYSLMRAIEVGKWLAYCLRNGIPSVLKYSGAALSRRLPALWRLCRWAWPDLDGSLLIMAWQCVPVRVDGGEIERRLVAGEMRKL